MNDDRPLPAALIGSHRAAVDWIDRHPAGAGVLVQTKEHALCREYSRVVFLHDASVVPPEVVAEVLLRTRLRK